MISGAKKGRRMADSMAMVASFLVGSGGALAVGFVFLAFMLWHTGMSRDS
jgi:hypothetical protein